MRPEVEGANKVKVLHEVPTSSLVQQESSGSAVFGIKPESIPSYQYYITPQNWTRSAVLQWVSSDHDAK